MSICTVDYTQTTRKCPPVSLMPSIRNASNTICITHSQYIMFLTNAQETIFGEQQKARRVQPTATRRVERPKRHRKRGQGHQHMQRCTGKQPQQTEWYDSWYRSSIHCCSQLRPSCSQMPNEYIRKSDVFDGTRLTEQRAMQFAGVLLASVRLKVSVYIRLAESIAHGTSWDHPAGRAAASERAVGSVYTCILNPAPQVWDASPSQGVLQSERGASFGSEGSTKELAQKH